MQAFVWPIKASKEVISKDNKDISAKSVQSPHDTEATYRNKDGNQIRGNVINVTSQMPEVIHRFQDHFDLGNEIYHHHLRLHKYAYLECVMPQRGNRITRSPQVYCRVLRKI